MRIPPERPRRRLTITVEDRGGEQGCGDIGPVASTLLVLARAEGLPGVSVFRGDVGYGPGSAEPGGRPVMIVIVGDPECVDDFATAVAMALPDGLITLEDVTEVVPTGRDSGRHNFDRGPCMGQAARPDRTERGHPAATAVAQHQ